MAEDRVYSVDAANAMLPELRDRLGRIREARQMLLRSARLVRERVAADGGGASGGADYWEAQSTLRAEIERLARENLVLRDPETGLLDFPGEREGRRVWLCWLPEEDSVAHWHEIDTGFIGRQPL
ncbi:MAG: DUF2203 family protein [Actinomycetota bacterium]